MKGGQLTPVWAWIVAYITPMDEGNSTLSGSQEKKKAWLWETFLNFIYCQLTQSFDYWFMYWDSVVV